MLSNRGGELRNPHHGLSEPGEQTLLGRQAYLHPRVLEPQKGAHELLSSGGQPCHCSGKLIYAPSRGSACCASRHLRVLDALHGILDRLCVGLGISLLLPVRVVKGSYSLLYAALSLCL